MEEDYIGSQCPKFRELQRLRRRNRRRGEEKKMRTIMMMKNKNKEKYIIIWGHAVAQWLRHSATNRKVTKSISEGVWSFSLT
jgi:hypothetical protein